MKTAIVAGLILISASFTAQAQIMKCVGKDGKIEFASSCPAGTKQIETGVTNRPAPAPAKSDDKAAGKDDAKGPKSLADRDAEFRKRQIDQKAEAEKADKKTAEDADRKRACQAAQSNLQTLKNRQRMSRIDPKTGERVFFEEADYARELPITERQVAENCSS